MSHLLSFEEQVLHSRGGGAVQRAHGIRHHGSYSVAEHSWGVSMLLYYLFRSDFKRLAVFAMVHDVPECLVGDMPSTAKENCSDHEIENAINGEFGLPGLDEMSARERTILKICDRLDLYLWAREQQAMGNLYINEVVNNLEETLSWPEGWQYAGERFEFAQDFYNCVRLSTRSIVPDRTNLLRKIKEHHGIKS